MNPPEHDFLVESHEVLHEWGVWSLRRASLTSPSGERFQRTYVDSPGAVAAVPVREDGQVILVWQYRAPLDAMSLELPAGMRDIDAEEPLVTAQRELAEEAGLIASSWDFLGRCMSSAGLTNSVVQIYLARDLHSVPFERHGPEEQFMSVVALPLARALELVESGEIADAKTAIGLLLAARRLGTG